MEQITYLHKYFRKLKPFRIGSKRTIREIVQYLLMPLGYPITSQSSLQMMQTSEVLEEKREETNVPRIIEQYTGYKISELEDEIRRRITERWDLQRNKHQKQLDLYLYSDN